MIWKNYQLDSTVSKATEDITLWRTGKGILEISKDTLVLPIKLNEQRKGYVFHGHGKLLLDTVVETEEGAIGRPVEKEIIEPFLMLGDIEEIQQHLSTADKEDLTETGYESEQKFVTKAEELCDQFLGRGRVHNHRCFGEDHGFVFAFLNEADKLDILVAKDSKLVYKAMDIVFVSNKNKVVLKSPSEVVCTDNGKSVIIKRGKSLIIRK
ncbi:MAG: hypothetical protein OEY24_04480 [Candidatus Bathyarchaeota archaeon]|nr:hypothetical protein [Candidatus Bathyarchaeota archaeon]MDH5494937.1 hypothetical protein [Candidatus Bathyarchaeota archaeon]